MTNSNDTNQIFFLLVLSSMKRLDFFLFSHIFKGITIIDALCIQTNYLPLSSLLVIVD